MLRRTWVLLVSIAVLAACNATTTAATTTSTTASTTVYEVSVENGAKLAATAKCANCHSTDEAPSITAPTLFGLAGSTVGLADGSSISADRAYIRKSITDPAAQIVEGDWPTAMPITTADYLSDDQVDALVLWVESLGP